MRKKMSLPVAAGAAVLLCGTMLFTGCTQAVIPETVKVQNMESNVIKVSSKELVRVEPDIAEIIYSVYSQASDAQTCQTQNNTDLQKVLDLLKAQGIEDKSIQTSNYGLNPVYDWESGKSISGYEMTTDISVANVALDSVGGLLSESVDAGINSISSVTYKSSKYEEAYQEALSKAIKAAKVKADVMAQAGGCKLGKIVQIEEFGSNQIARTNYSAAGAGMKESAVSDMGMMPGEIEIEANINVEFTIE